MCVGTREENGQGELRARMARMVCSEKFMCTPVRMPSEAALQIFSAAGRQVAIVLLSGCCFEREGQESRIGIGEGVVM